METVKGRGWLHPANSCKPLMTGAQASVPGVKAEDQQKVTDQLVLPNAGSALTKSMNVIQKSQNGHLRKVK